MNADIFYNRALFFKILIITIFIVFIVRLSFLQLFDSSLKDRSNSNALLFQTVYPARGLIYDRNGKILVYNKPLYDIMVVTRDITHDFDTVSFCSLLNMHPNDFDSILKKIKNRRTNRGFSPYTQQFFLKDMTHEEIVSLQENLYRFKGVFLQKKYIRGYNFSHAASHILGSIGETNQDDLIKDSYYQPGEAIGKEGVEKFYEEYLRGKKGVNVFLRDSKGRIQGHYQNGKLDEEAIPGMDLTLSVDINLQLLAEQLLLNKVGSVVAIVPNSGEILTLVSSPSYDLETMNSKTRNNYYASLLNHPNKPLINRATCAIYSPGSCLKIVLALLCLQEGTLTPQTKYFCDGPLSSPIKCTHYHDAFPNVLEAIEQSCNPFFWNAFRDFLQKNGYGPENINFKEQYNKWKNGVESFGLGHIFENTDISNQYPGNVPTASHYDKIYGKSGWKALTIRSLSIGQGEILVTPLQLANIAAVIANEGFFIPPHFNKDKDFTVHTYQTDIDKQHFALVKEGMRNVMQKGTGRFYDAPDLSFCGKTGTVQNNNGKDHALFIGFAPKDNPQIAIAVVVENAGFGATWATPIASLLMEYYLTGDVANKTLLNKLIETNLTEK